MSHTPGPWLQFADTNIVIGKYRGGPGAEDLRIAEVATNTRHDEGRYNIALIVAAPDMLDALRAVADLSVRTDGRFAQMAIDRFRAIADAAIAKAEGK